MNNLLSFVKFDRTEKTVEFNLLRFTESMQRTFVTGVSARYDKSCNWLSSMVRMRMLFSSEKAARDKFSPLPERSSSSNLLANGANALLGITFSLFSLKFRLVRL